MKKYTIISFVFFIPTFLFTLFCGIICMEYYLFDGADTATIGKHGSFIADFLNLSNPRMMPVMAVLSGLCSIGCIATMLFYGQLFKNKVVFDNMDSWEQEQQKIGNAIKDLEKAKKMYNDKLVELTINDKSGDTTTEGRNS